MAPRSDQGLNRAECRPVCAGIMSPARLSALDAAFPSLESAAAPMHVGWAAVFAPPAAGPRPSYEDVCAHIASRLGRAPRYRQKLVSVPLGLGDPVWVDDPDFDIADNVVRASHGDFATLVDEVLSSALQPDRPLWELWIAEELDDGMIGVVGKAHHCLVDGLAAVELMALLLDAEPSPAADDGAADGVNGWSPRSLPSAVALVRDAVGQQVDEALRVAKLPLSFVRNPSQTGARAWRAARVSGFRASLTPARSSPSVTTDIAPPRGCRPGSPINSEVSSRARLNRRPTAPRPVPRPPAGRRRRSRSRGRPASRRGWPRGSRRRRRPCEPGALRGGRAAPPVDLSPSRQTRFPPLLHAGRGRCRFAAHAEESSAPAFAT